MRFLKNRFVKAIFFLALSAFMVYGGYLLYNFLYKTRNFYHPITLKTANRPGELSRIDVNLVPLDEFKDVQQKLVLSIKNGTTSFFKVLILLKFLDRHSEIVSTEEVGIPQVKPESEFSTSLWIDTRRIHYYSYSLQGGFYNP